MNRSKNVQTETNTISNSEIIEALSKSGYFLETRILSLLNSRGYLNIPNSVYPDSNTGKSREIDIFSESPRVTYNIKKLNWLHFEFGHRLIIECINNPQPVAFFKRPDNIRFTNFGKFKFQKIVKELPVESEISPELLFDDFTTSSTKFHYNQFKNASQYCSFSQKKDKDKEWMASHPDALHETFNKLLDYTNHVNSKYSEWMPRSVWKDGVFIMFFFPVIVFQNKIFEVNITGDTPIIEEKEHIVFEFSRYNSEKSDTILVDIVQEQYFNSYLSKVISGISELQKLYVNLYKGKHIELHIYSEK